MFSPSKRAFTLPSRGGRTLRAWLCGHPKTMGLGIVLYPKQGRKQPSGRSERVCELCLHRDKPYGQGTDH